MRLVDIAHQWIQPYLSEGCIAIDGTVGNGYDTSFLAEGVGRSGTVYGFDLQAMAIEVATMVLKTKRCFPQCRLIQAGHETMVEHLPNKVMGQISVIMFNLGYLPHGDKTVITQPGSTVKALDQCLQFLKPEGVISILSYRGHDGGLAEFQAVRTWIDDNEPSVSVLRVQDSEHPGSTGPFLWMLQKR